MRLLVHIAGESDLLLAPDGGREDRAARVSHRRQQLTNALESPAGPAAAYRLLAENAWNDGYKSTSAPTPLFAALAALAADATTPAEPKPAPDLDVVVLGTRQNPPHLLDTLPVAKTIVEVLTGAATRPVRTADVVASTGFGEAEVVAALGRHLATRPCYRQALITWGSGSTALTMGTLTALSRAGFPWHLLTATRPAAYEIIDPLLHLDLDPVIGVLVRWRMFAALDELASHEPPLIRLTPRQHDLVRRAADRHRAGFQARDCAALRAVLADAVVRRDGTASLAVRRYVTCRYEELLAADQLNHPAAVNLLQHATTVTNERKANLTLGQLLGKIRDHSSTDPAIRASVTLASHHWLMSPETDALQNIGKGSHTLRPPAPTDAAIIGTYLTRYHVDGTGWDAADLPDPPVTPADTVLAVWLAGRQPDPDNATVGAHLAHYGVPDPIRDHLGVDKIHIQSIILGVDGETGSMHHADNDARKLQTSGQQAWTLPTDLTGSDLTTLQESIEERINPRTAALLLIPTGNKPTVLKLMQAMRHAGARRGIPLFVRQTANPHNGNAHTDVYLWPALTGGDLPLLIAAREALQALELDVAWRLLAASAIDPAITDTARHLADTFASRRPPARPRTPHPPTTNDPTARPAAGTIAQRITLVHAALARTTTTADRIRLLVLAADTLEASIAATQKPNERKGIQYANFRKRQATLARHQNTAAAENARIFLLLNEARNQVPVTHGTTDDPDAVVADAADRLSRRWDLPPAEAARLPRDVPSLLKAAVAAANTLTPERPDQTDDLLGLSQTLDLQIAQTIHQRRQPPAAATPIGGPTTTRS